MSFPEFRPFTITEVAKQLGVDPFEVIRRCVALKMIPDGLAFTPEHVARLRHPGQ